MRDAVVQTLGGARALIMAAAVADYQPAEPLGRKIKREGTDGMSLSLVRTPDILLEVGERPGLVKVGFAAESHDLRTNAIGKLKAKGLDLIALNDITATDSGFAVDTNQVILFDRDGGEEHLPLMTKYEVAWRILDKVSELIKGRAR
jgi:phosphopantothenoylcysteine decarboxylase/phosphopantothenate--cysteine ligase